MQIDVLTLFPEMFQGILSEGILSRAIAQKILQIRFHQIRDFTEDKHRTVDDLPYGGGAGMVMKPEPLYQAWEAARAADALPCQTIYLSPQGKPLTQAMLSGWARAREQERLILVCGRYEGVDERFLELSGAQEISLGDFVLSGGEIPAMALIDGIMRQLPGALGNSASLDTESFSGKGILEAPHYTRPPEFRGKEVPPVLLSGNHREIERWRAAQAQARTQEKRPDLLKKRD